MKKKKAHVFNKLLLMTTSIVFLNFTGITYASLKDSINIRNSVTTGKMDLSFDNGTKVLEYNARLKHNGRITFPVHIINNSTIPIQLIDYDMNDIDKGIQVKVSNDKITVNVEGKWKNKKIYHFDIGYVYSQKTP